MATRREFLIRSASGLITAAIAAHSTSALAQGFAGISGKYSNASEFDLAMIPILQGWTTESETELKILRPSNQRYQYEAVGPDGERLSSQVVDEFQFNSSSKITVDHLIVVGLSLNKTYRLRISNEMRQIEEREFGALDLSRRKASIALLSCMHDHYTDSQVHMWAAIQRSAPDLLLFIGDACYADYFSDSHPSELWRRHCETRMALDVFKWKRLVPSLAVWDDHDFGLDNVDGSFPYKLDSLRIFQALFGSRSSDRLFRGPGVSQVAYAFGLRLSLMDDRYFRSPPKGETHWGRNQENFLIEHLQGEALPTLLCNGSQFFGAYQGGESYEGDHPQSFMALQKTLQAVESPILFCSGDVHYSEVMKVESAALGYPTFELTSSSVHSFALPAWTSKNPRRVASSSHHNCLVVDIETSPTTSELQFRTRCIGRNETYFQFADRLKR